MPIAGWFIVINVWVDYRGCCLLAALSCWIYTEAAAGDVEKVVHCIEV